MSASKQPINQSCPPDVERKKKVNKKKQKEKKKGVESAESQHPCHSDLT